MQTNRLTLLGTLLLPLFASLACAVAAGAPGADPAPADASLRQDCDRAVNALLPLLQQSEQEVLAPGFSESGRLHLPSLEGPEAARAVDTLASALQENPRPSPMGQAAHRFLNRVNAIRLRTRVPGLLLGEEYGLDLPSASRVATELALASLREAESAGLALRTVLELLRGMPAPEPDLSQASRTDRPSQRR